jgi:hypothetical protein
MVECYGKDGVYLDPFGGVGGVHDAIGKMENPKVATFAVELEPEWAEQSAQKGLTVCADFLQWSPHPSMVENIAGVVTSPTYGNRMADHHNAKDPSKRITYRHSLGRPLSDNNSGGMQWGVEYRAFHIKAWLKVEELLQPGGLFVLNVKDHMRQGARVDVCEWHSRVLRDMGFYLLDEEVVPVKGMGFGANGRERIGHEMVYAFKKVGHDRP